MSIELILLLVSVISLFITGLVLTLRLIDTFSPKYSFKVKNYDHIGVDDTNSSPKDNLTIELKNEGWGIGKIEKITKIGDLHEEENREDIELFQNKFPKRIFPFQTILLQIYIPELAENIAEIEILDSKKGYIDQKIGISDWKIKENQLP